MFRFYDNCSNEEGEGGSSQNEHPAKKDPMTELGWDFASNGGVIQLLNSDSIGC